MPETQKSTPFEDTPARWPMSGAIGALILLLLSGVFVWGGLELGLGSFTRLGTGAFPFISGSILIVLAVAIIFHDRHSDGLAEKPDWIGFLAISAALAIFASTADRFGLVPAAFLTTIVASLPDRSLSLVGKGLLGSFVASASWLLFIKALDLPFKAFTGF